MAIGRSTPLDRILGRLEDLDATNLTILVQRLARERKLFETVINIVREGILVINQDGVVEYANEAAQHMVGFGVDDLGKAVLWKLIPGLARTLDFSVDGTFSEVSVVSRELQLTYPENRFVRLYLVPFHEDDVDEHWHYAVILSDVTEDKVSTQEMIESEKISSIIMLAAGVAHELGNPLNSLTIHLQLIKRQLKKLENSPQLEKIDESLDVCTGEVERLDGIITNFLEAVRPNPPDFQDIDPVTVLEDVLEVLGQELKDRSVVIDIDCPRRLPVIAADRNQLKQVYFNVLKNAFEAMEHGGTIKIRARADDEFVKVQFGDSGKGIDKEAMARVFEPYYTTKKDGHGLGMMIVQRIMREHGGQLGLDSRAGVGTVVTLQFPQRNKRVRMLNE